MERLSDRRAPVLPTVFRPARSAFGRTRLLRLLTLGLVAFGAAAATAARAQTSASYDMKARVVNEGGNPAQGVVLASGSFRMGLDAVGQGLYAPVMGSASFSIGVGFATPYLAPGEVFGVRVLADHKTLMWSVEPAADHYHVYRDLVSTLPGSYGSCWAAPVPSTSVLDVANPAAASGFFYLVTADTTLAEEGTKGFNSAGMERANPAPCP